MMKIVCGILLILLYVKEGASLKCFACRYSDREGGTNCDTTYTSNFLVTCKPEQKSCFTSYDTSNVSIVSQAVENTIIRGCTSFGVDDCGGSTSNCWATCSTDGCNSNPGTDITNLPAGSVDGSRKCYSCYYNSAYGDSYCGDTNVPSNSLVSCLPGQEYCRTITTTLKSITITRRGCATTDVDSCKIPDPDIEVCTKGCSTDGCNDGNGIQATRVVIFIALLISFAFSAF